MNTQTLPQSVQTPADLKQWAKSQAQTRQFSKFLDDLCAFITFGLEHNKSADWILGNVAHDLHGIHREGFGGCFSPRSTGFAAKL